MLSSHQVSVLNREPMGMKLTEIARSHKIAIRFSAQPRADGDEARFSAGLVSLQ